MKKFLKTVGIAVCVALIGCTLAQAGVTPP